MRVAFCGNFSVPYCSEVYYRQELESLGVEVCSLQETEVTGEEILQEALKSDALFWVHSHGFFIKGLPMGIVLQKLKDAGVATFAYHLDLYMPIEERWAEYKDSVYMNNLDHFFTVDKLMAEWVNENTKTKGHFLMAGIPTSQTYIEDFDRDYSTDVAFIGSKNYHSLWKWRPELITYLQFIYGDKFTHWGRDGKALVREQRMNKAYSSCKIAVGDTLCIDFNYPYYLSDRIFNSTGAGTFTLHPYVKGLEDVFEIDKEIVTFEYGNLPQVKEKIDYYLNHPKERNDIRIAGYLRTKKDHTYRNRVQTMLTILKKEGAI